MAAKKKKAAKKYMGTLHDWIEWYHAKLNGIDWTKLKRAYRKPKAGRGGAGDNPPPNPKWPP